MSLNICALMIGRGGSSLKDKNILPVHGVPLLLWSCAAASRSKYVKNFFISSDDERILETAQRAEYKPIVRPVELATDTARSTDAVRHALDLIEAQIGSVDILVVQHANVGTITPQMIDDCIEIMLRDDTISAVVPSHIASDYHPMRAKRVEADGSLKSFFEGPISPNRQELPAAVFFDHSFWVLRGRQAVFDQNGQEPWPCMGRKIVPYITEGCLDVHSMEDYQKTADWLMVNKVEPPQF